jgi:hypothetical protein
LPEEANVGPEPLPSIPYEHLPVLVEITALPLSAAIEASDAFWAETIRMVRGGLQRHVAEILLGVGCAEL